MESEIFDSSETDADDDTHKDDLIDGRWLDSAECDNECDEFDPFLQ